MEDKARSFGWNLGRKLEGGGCLMEKIGGGKVNNE
jgi:hypothetical protein